MKAPDVLDALEKLHPPAGGEWAFTREFNRIDGYAVRLFTGSGKHSYRRVAYEVKVSWSDFVAELRQPEKRLGALEVSHQFYFAMPAELAYRALPRVVAGVPEAGLLAILDEPSKNFRSGPCVGAAAQPLVQVCRRAPIRPCRAWSMLEITNLLRRQHGGRETALRQRAEEAKRRAEQHKYREEEARAGRDAAEARLAALLGHTVVEGSEWAGAWQGLSSRASRPARLRVVAVEEMYGSDGPMVRSHRLDAAGEPAQGYDARALHTVGGFLARFSPVEAGVAAVRGGG